MHAHTSKKIKKKLDSVVLNRWRICLMSCIGDVDEKMYREYKIFHYAWRVSV
jgi:hypothetical protein